MPEYIPLAFGLESLYPPLTLTSQQLRDLYIKLAEPCRFSEFKLLGEGQGARLAEGNNRNLTISHDRFAYRDDFTHAMFSTFMEDMDHILKTLKDTFRIPVLLHSKILIRLLMPHQSQENTVSYFQKHLLASAVPLLEEFGRPLSGMGIKMVFPATQEKHSAYHVRIEPYYRDMKMFYLENQAQYFDPIVKFEDLKNNLEESYEFLREKAGPFIEKLSQNSQ